MDTITVNHRTGKGEGRTDSGWEIVYPVVKASNAKAIAEKMPEANLARAINLLVQVVGNQRATVAMKADFDPTLRQRIITESMGILAAKNPQKAFQYFAMIATDPDQAYAGLWDLLQDGRSTTIDTTDILSIPLPPAKRGRKARIAK